MKTLPAKVGDRLFGKTVSAASARRLPKSTAVREQLARKAAASKKGERSLWSRMHDLVIPSDSLSADLSSKKGHQKKYGQPGP